ncbi:hypothetical protein N7454_002828 [Penicillium verhagenii]|nr:hypothetical protein N7454_002828 [Penicillium verhagenii]
MVFREDKNMSHSTHIIDPDGEVIIMLRNANSPFAQMPEDRTLGKKVIGVNVPVIVDKINAPEENIPEEGVHKEATSEIRIQVSAKHVMFASSFFKKSLTGLWKESMSYQQEGSVEITADGWDLGAFLIVLRAIHCQYNKIPKKLTLEMLAKVAAIADYYNCKDILYVMTDRWIDSLDEKICNANPRDLMLWIWVSWFFHLPAWFKESTSLAITSSCGLINSRGLPIPCTVIASVNKARQNSIGNVMLLLDETRMSFLGGSRGCDFECQSMMYGALAKQIQANCCLSPWPVTPFPNICYSSIRQTVLSFKSPNWFHFAPLSPFGRRDIVSHTCDSSNFSKIFGKLNVVIEGLDLDKPLPLEEVCGK